MPCSQISDFAEWLVKEKTCIPKGAEDRVCGDLFSDYQWSVTAHGVDKC